ncbi:MAG: serine/threonine-protein kinase, partial [Planctomycetes bacterium]|nr:serine/threonine-protein kinase [Planctomycetota bacterium]
MSELDFDGLYEIDGETLQAITEVSSEFDRQLQAGQSPRLEDFVVRIPVAGLAQGFCRLLGSELDRRIAAGEQPSMAEYVTRFSQHETLVRDVFSHREATEIHDPGTAATCASVPVAAVEEMPDRLGRFIIERELGHGTFAVVYLATDPIFPRLVALKVPYSERVETEEQRLEFIRDAQFAAQLNHSGVVTVYEIDVSGPVPIIVQEYMAGGDLKQRLSAGDVTSDQAVGWMISIAEAVAAAHKKNFFHRDLKPANILLDDQGHPRVADFGLALHERDQLTSKPEFAGTLAYMSPEQVRCEINRLDGRSDTWSLGVILYEMLTGQRPFTGTSTQISDQIRQGEPRPPREIKPQISSELQRICLKCLEKRASRRYGSALELADDLRHWQLDRQRKQQRVRPQPRTEDSPESELTSVQGPPQVVVPKGLRSFDSRDADFFLELLPGTRDRAGLPDTIRFWKSLIEELDPANTFNVGVLYGPSGCGKSSLVKAGILPRLGAHVVTIFIEATPSETETRLQVALRRLFPDIPPGLSLPEVLAGIRDRRWGPASRKLLIIVDQFEQWLHAAPWHNASQLVDAFRHCDGEHLQGLLLVREDFWTGISRFMQDLEIPLQEQRNALMVDRFDLVHARKVMVQFGQAYGQLPEYPTPLSKEQQAFLDEAIEQLSEQGRVICVRLAVFCEMFKNRPWTPASLRAGGGIEGVGATFLEEAFSAPSAPAEHRQHQDAVRAILNSLLPAAGTDIKGQMRSEQELQEAAGYAQRPLDFATVMRILDTNTRLITPTEAPAGAAVQGPGAGHYYQLTHDYLVHSLRTWLTYKQKATRRGRAELELEDLAHHWSHRPDHRLLPSLGQWLRIHLLTSRSRWTAPKRKMIRAANRYYLWRGFAVSAAVLLIGCGWYNYRNQLQAYSLRDRLLAATIQEVPFIVGEMAPYHEELRPLLLTAESRARSSGDSRKLLNIALARLPGEPDQVVYLTNRLLRSDPNELPVIRDALHVHKHELRAILWNVLHSHDEQQKKHRLQAAAALASYDVANESELSDAWKDVADVIVAELISALTNNPSHLGPLVTQLRPVRAALMSPLSKIYRDLARSPLERSIAANLLAQFADQDVPRLVNDLLDADSRLFQVFMTPLIKHRESALLYLQNELNRQSVPGELPEQGDRLASRQANAALALWQTGES